MKDRKTDYGTVILHWLFAAALGVAFVTGLRIATEAPGRQWLNLLDAILPRTNVWVPHMQAALVSPNRMQPRRVEAHHPHR